MSSRIDKMKFSFNLPTSWVHGIGLSSEIDSFLKDLGVKCPVIITDKRLVNVGVLEPIYNSLKKADINYTIIDEVTSEPTVKFFDLLSKKLKEMDFDSFIAVGGGSVMDVAKGLRIIAEFGGSIRDYAGLNKISGKIEYPLIAIPTTSGTGSEVSVGAVFIDEENKTKFAVVDVNNCPTLALTDPELTTTMPPSITAITGIDALVHAAESYVSRQANPVTEPIALQAINLIGNSIEKAVSNGNDIKARECMQLGSTLAMISASNAQLGLCHALGMPLCAIYGMPHGQAVGMVLPYVLELNKSTVPDKIKNIFSQLNYTDKENNFTKIEELINKMGIFSPLSKYGFNENQIPNIVKGTLNSFQTPNNPSEVTEQDVINIINKIKE
jgi:alcohol dehydrogenase class IV